jgi:hypothetical protein
VDVSANPILLKHARDDRLSHLVRQLWDLGIRRPKQIAKELVLDDPSLILPGESAGDFIAAIAALVRQFQERAAAIADLLLPRASRR